MTVTDDNRWVDRYGDRGGNKYDVEPLSASALFIINIEDINERPWVVTRSLRTTYSNGTYDVFRVTEGSPLGTPVGSPLEADDQDDETEIVGYFLEETDADTAIECKFCPAGYVNNKIKEISCLECIPVSQQESIAKTSCKECKLGQYRSHDIFNHGHVVIRHDWLKKFYI